MNAVIYCRYSCEKQNEMSIDGQLKVCHEYAEKNDLNVVGTYIDRAISGRTDDRPQFQQMIKDSAKKSFDIVLVYKLDRFSRDKYQSAIYRNVLKQNKVSVMSAMENIPNTPEGVLLESVLEGLNQYYSMELAQKIKRSINIKHEREEFCGGHLTYGYAVEDKKLVVNEEEAQVVRDIFTLIARGLEPVDVRAKMMFKGSIQKIIRNPRYKGINCPRIIDDDLWIQANDVLDLKTDTPNHRRVAYNYKLSGKVFCGVCGAHMTGGQAKSGRYRYYECREKCGNKRIDSDTLESIVIKAVMELITDEDNLNRIANECLKLIKERLNKENNVNEIKKQIEELNKQRDSLIELYMNTQSKYINAKLIELDAKQEQLEKSLYATNHIRATIPAIIQIIREYQQNPPLSLEDSICKDIVRKVIVYEDEIEIIIGDYVDEDDDIVKVRNSRSESHHQLEIRNLSIVIRVSR